MLEEYELEEGEIDERNAKRVEPSDSALDSTCQLSITLQPRGQKMTYYLTAPGEPPRIDGFTAGMAGLSNSADVRQRVSERSAMMLTCRALAYPALVPGASDTSTCSSPASWTNIWISNGEWVDGHKQATLDHVLAQLRWSNKRGVQIGILLPNNATTAGEYLVEIWAELMKPKFRNRLEGVHFEGCSQCEGDRVRCFQSQILDQQWFGAILDHPRPKAISAKLLSPDGVERLCVQNHPPTRMDITGLHSLGYPFPLLLANPGPSDYLKHLDIRNQEHLLARSLIQLCPGLHSLVWGRNGNGVPTAPPVTLPHLRRLTIINLRHIPPINSPNLTELTVADDYFAFTADMLTSIVGHLGSLPAMRELNFLGSPMTNNDVMNIFTRCPRLTTIRAETRAEVRTEFFHAVVARIRGIYAYHRSGLSTVEISRAPSSKKKDQNAVPAFRLMQYLGRSPEGKDNIITYHPEPWRVRVDNFPGHFDETMEEMHVLCALNGWDNNFLATCRYDDSLQNLQNSTEKREQNSRNSIVCVFASRRAAEDCPRIKPVIEACLLALGWNRFFIPLKLGSAPTLGLIELHRSSEILFNAAAKHGQSMDALIGLGHRLAAIAGENEFHVSLPRYYVRCHRRFGEIIRLYNLAAGMLFGLPSIVVPRIDENDTCWIHAMLALNLDAQISDVLVLVSNQKPGQAKPWFEKPNQASWLV
ncbi:hypothetical protein C8R43DRAFT_944964 [Mycena crocata]|nr:hypothetical protein C8R43DRAFT_944964 [Mycena crocata]